MGEDVIRVGDFVRHKDKPDSEACEVIAIKRVEDGEENDRIKVRLSRRFNRFYARKELAKTDAQRARA
jgi:hypothetical protein|tara:strand:- start:331 stop:534 length:204 start_codon:yes stop_codon:yes gene_type:complete